MPIARFDGSGGLSGNGNASAGWINAASFGFSGAASNSYNTGALQAWADAIGAARLAGLHGIVGVVPAGRYDMSDGITLPNMASGSPLTVHAHGAAFRLTSANTGVSLIKTALPTSNSDAEAKNDIRDQWRWYGGTFVGNAAAGTKAFELNAVSRLVMDNVHITNFEEGIRARFCLHFRPQNSVITQCLNYGIIVETEADAWTGATPSNAAGNALIIDNVRFLGRASQIAQLRIAHCGHIVRDCTFEGANPGINFDYENVNTSALGSRFDNCHMENDPTVAQVRINTLHDYEVDFQYVNSSSAPYIQVIEAAAITVHRLGYPAPNSTFSGNPILETPGDTYGGSATRWVFRGGGVAHTFDPRNTALWVAGRLPKAIYADGLFEDGSATANVFMSRFNSGIAVIEADNGKLNIDGTVVGTQT